MDRFATEAQDRFLRIRRGTHILYRSGDPADHSFSASKIPLMAPGPPIFWAICFFPPASFPPNGDQITIDSGQSYVLWKAWRIS